MNDTHSEQSDGNDGAAVELDMRGQRCPAPIIALGRMLRSDPGTVVRLLADDPAATFDIPAWCRLTGATLLQQIAVEPTRTAARDTPSTGTAVASGAADRTDSREVSPGATAYVVRLPGHTGDINSSRAT